MLSSVCEVTSWLDWWLSTCGGFQEHLPDEVHGNFERLMLSESRALEFLGNHGITTLGNLLLSHRDSLLLDARSTFPAEEVARLRYADLPSCPGIFLSALLDSALNKMRAASNDALVQRTLHPPKIPHKSSAVPSKAGTSSASSADRGGASPVVPRLQQQASTAPSSSSAQRRRKQRGRKGKAPFSGASGGRWQPKRGREKVLLTGSRLCCEWGAVCRHIGGTGRQLEQVPGCYPSCGTGIASPSWILLLPSLVPWYRFWRTGQGLLDRRPCARRSRRCYPRILWRSSSIRVPASTVVFSWWKRWRGGWRPMIDLSHLNEFVLQTLFKMETVASVLLSIRDGDFLASIDLKDTYFQIPVHQSSRKLMRFLSAGTFY